MSVMATVWLRSPPGVPGQLVKNGYFRCSKRAWREVAGILRHAAAGLSHIATTIVLCPDGASLAAYDPDSLVREAKHAQRYGWNATVYALIKAQYCIDPPNEKLLARWRVWIERVRTVGIRDLIEPAYIGAIGPSLLRSQQRAVVTERLSVDGAWNLQFPSDTDPHLIDWLAAAADMSGVPAEKTNGMLVSVRGPDAVRAAVLEALLQRDDCCAGAPVRAAAILGDLPGPQVQQFCTTRGLPVLTCGGRFELGFVLSSLASRYVARVDCGREKFVTVATRRFARAAVSSKPVVLVTSSFDPNFDPYPQQWRLALDYIQAALKGAGPAEPVVQPALTLPNLRRLVTKLTREGRRIAAWVHIGHGGIPGMRPHGTRNDAAPAEWLAAFVGDNPATAGRDYQDSLPFVLLYACHSVPTALCFAEAGAGVAVGFENGVYAMDAARLLRGLIKTTLQPGPVPEKIVQAFRQACGEAVRRTGRCLAMARPVAFRELT